MFLDLLRRTMARHLRAQRGTGRASAGDLHSIKLNFFCSGSLIPGLAAMLASLLTTTPAVAVPSFAIQTGQPCAACHIGAFGPQLTPYGRDFKLHGYVASDGKDHGLPLAFTTQTSFTHTLQPQDGGAAPGFKANDNFAVDQLSLYYA
jgi:hypothetical protein